MAAFPTLRPHVLAAVAVLSSALPMSGSPAAAQDRCEGTLCDLYYDHMAKPTQAQPAPQPAQNAARAQPAPPAQAGDGLLAHLFSGGSTPAPQADGAPPVKKPLVAVQGGGLVGLMQGQTPQRCTGTLCDFYYGGPPKEEPAAAEPAAAPAPAERAAEAEAEIDAPVEASHGIEPRESVRGCAATQRDPWACYR